MGAAACVAGEALLMEFGRREDVLLVQVVDFVGRHDEIEMR
jgi:hypothetical protein